MLSDEPKVGEFPALVLGLAIVELVSTQSSCPPKASLKARFLTNFIFLFPVA
jgi:hypothetical protein